MFEQKTYVLSFSKESLIFSRVTDGKETNATILETIPYTPETLVQTLRTIQKKYTKHVRILLPESFAYTGTLAVPFIEIMERADIQKKAQELIPEDLSNTVWDYSVISETALKTTTITLLALVQPFATTLNTALKQAGIVAEVVEPISCTLARGFPQEVSPIVILSAQESSFLAVAVEKGHVIATQTLSMVTSEAVEQFIQFLRTACKKTIQKIVVTDQTLKASLTTFDKKDIPIIVQSVDLTILIGTEKIDTEKNQSSLRISMPTTIGPAVIQQSPQEGQKKQPILLVILLLMIIVGLITGAFFYFLNQEKEAAAPQKPIVSKTPHLNPPKETPTPKPQLTKSALSLAVLNGTKTAGLALSLASALTQQGYTVTTTGNADTSSYTQTEIRYKKIVPYDFRLALDKLVKTFYANIVEKDIADSEATDVVIVIGQ